MDSCEVAAEPLFWALEITGGWRRVEFSLLQSEFFIEVGRGRGSASALLIGANQTA